MFRQVVLLLVAYPLLLPPGMCICGAGRDRDDESRLSQYGRPHACSLPPCGQTKIKGDLCGGTHGVPADEQCPPSCPASKQADHSKLAEKAAEKWPVVTVWAAAIVPQTFSVDAIPGHRIQAPSFLSRPLAAPSISRSARCGFDSALHFLPLLEGLVTTTFPAVPCRVRETTPVNVLPNLTRLLDFP